jgi:hypothetical protein
LDERVGVGEALPRQRHVVEAVDDPSIPVEHAGVELWILVGGDLPAGCGRSALSIRS